MLPFTSIQAVLFDMDGVLYRGKQILAGVHELLSFLSERGIAAACITNNASLTPAQYEQKLTTMGIAIPGERVITSAIATGRYLRTHYPYGTRVFIVGMSGLRQALLADGYFVEDDEQPELVVQGVDFTLTYETLRKATLCIRRGATFIATNPDTTFPSEEGLIPGAGSITAALVAASETIPLVVGKPAPTMFRVAAEMLSVPAAATLVIGDRLDTDIAGAISAAMLSALVLTGVSSRRAAESSPIQPTAIFADLPALLTAWRMSG